VVKVADAIRAAANLETSNLEPSNLGTEKPRNPETAR
jgi:hypothetical protein